MIESSSLHCLKMSLTSMVGGLIKRCLPVLAFAGCCMAAELPADPLAGLGNDAFEVREASQILLIDWALKNKDQAPGLLFRHRNATKDPEVRTRLLEVLEALAMESYAKQGKGFIGIQMRDEMIEVPGEDKPVAAIRITFVLPEMAAEQAGIEVGELLLGIDGKRWPSPATEAMRNQVMAMKPTTKITLQVLREGKIEDVEVTLVRRPLRADNPLFDRMPQREAEAERRQWEEFFQKWTQQHNPDA